MSSGRVAGLGLVTRSLTGSLTGRSRFQCRVWSGGRASKGPHPQRNRFTDQDGSYLRLSRLSSGRFLHATHTSRTRSAQPVFIKRPSNGPRMMEFEGRGRVPLLERASGNRVAIWRGTTASSSRLNGSGRTGPDGMWVCQCRVDKGQRKLGTMLTTAGPSHWWKCWSSFSLSACW